MQGGHRTSDRGCRGEGAFGDRDSFIGEVSPCEVESLVIRQRQPESMDVPCALAVVVGPVEDHPVAANHPREVAAAELRVVGLDIGLGSAAEPHQAIRRREVRAASPTGHRTFHVLPPPFGEEAVVGAGDDLRAVGQGHPVRPLHRGPLRQHRGRDVPPVRALLPRAHDPISDREFTEQAVAPIGEQDRGVGGEAVRACVCAAPIGVDRPVEGHRRAARHVVQGRLRAHLVEGHPLECGRSDRPHERSQGLETGECRGIRLFESLSVPPHTVSRT